MASLAQALENSNNWFANGEFFTKLSSLVNIVSDSKESQVDDGLRSVLKDSTKLSVRRRDNDSRGSNDRRVNDRRNNLERRDQIKEYPKNDERRMGNDRRTLIDQRVFESRKDKIERRTGGQIRPNSS